MTFTVDLEKHPTPLWTPLHTTINTINNHQQPPPEWAKGLAKPLWTSHIQHTPSLNYYCLVDATELWAPERPDTETVSFLKQSISWTLDIKRGTHNTIIQFYIYIYIYIFTTHTYFPFKFARQTSHNCLYYILCFCHFVHCLLDIVVCVLSCHCHSVALWSFCHYNKSLVCVNIPGQ